MELVVGFVEVMNIDFWLDFVNVYDVVERNICKRSYVKFIELFFVLIKVEEIEEKSGDVLEVFKLECELEDEIVVV